MELRTVLSKVVSTMKFMQFRDAFSAISIVSIIAVSSVLLVGCGPGSLNPAGQTGGATVTASPGPSIGDEVLRGARGVVQFQAREQGIADAERTEPLLDRSGFESMPLNDPNQQPVIAGLAPFKINQLGADNKISYWYADPAFCKCAYVGDEIAYATFEQAQRAQKQQQSEERRLANSRNEVYLPMNSEWNPVAGSWTPDARR